ncbi:MAG: hypothetical protein ABSG46_03360 [Candidatus Binataceae bacterium]
MKYSMNPTHYLRYAVIGIVALMLGSINPGRAESASSSPQAVYYTALNGNYSFLAPSYYGYYIGQGTLTFDGKGHVTGVLNYNVDTVPCIGMTLNGTYTVNPGLASGFAQMSLTSVSTNGCGNDGNGDTLNTTITIASGGNILYLTEVDPDTTGYFTDNFYPFGATATHY